MPSSRPFLVDLPRVAREVPRLLLSPLLLPRSDCPLRLTVRLGTPSGSRNLVSWKTTSCAASLFGPAVTWRTVNLPLLHCPLCQVGCVASPEDFTCPVSLDGTGPYDWTSRSLHVSCLTGQARSTGLSENLSLLVWLRVSDSESLTLQGSFLWRFHPFFGSAACVLRELSFTVVTGRPPPPTRSPETNHS